jgi:hypothetical protein
LETPKIVECVLVPLTAARGRQAEAYADECPLQALNGRLRMGSFRHRDAIATTGAKNRLPGARRRRLCGCGFITNPNRTHRALDLIGCSEFYCLPSNEMVLARVRHAIDQR